MEWPPLITAAATLTGVYLGYRGALRVQQRTIRLERQRHIATVAGEALAAVGELQTALTTYQLQWGRRTTALPTIAVAATELIVAGRDWRKAAPTALRAAHSFHRDREHAAQIALAAPTSRLLSALIAVSLLGDQPLQRAADQLREGVADLLASVGNTKEWKHHITFDSRIHDFRSTVDDTLEQLHRPGWLRRQWQTLFRRAGTARQALLRRARRR
ncbi:hypothetical protein SAMN04489729_6977 [Amycolatopsis lurida]|uniref:hypothetical protein n=1 Tax=Amycolatopsis lurida TaxID=31959 RepID=UPI000898D472|nr:hypothetical protein [Amycolatopsis lurida]SEE29298.1 hypothetical protein SAMN04489729_6977 [Amycolatopsis lurida]